MNVLRFTAPAIAGYSIVWWGYESVCIIMTGLFVAATQFALGLPRTRVAPEARATRAISDVMGGFQYARREPTIALILGFTLFVVLCSMPYMMLLPIFTEDILKADAGTPRSRFSQPLAEVCMPAIRDAGLTSRHRPAHDAGARRGGW